MNSLKTACYTILLAILFFNSCYADVVIIGNSAIQESAISKSDVKRIFLGKMKKWTNGEKIKPAVLKKGKTHQAFIETFVEKTLSTFATYWKRALFEGTGIPPKSFTSEENIIRYVSNTPGAIGYVSTETELGDVKIFSINE